MNFYPAVYSYIEHFTHIYLLTKIILLLCIDYSSFMKLITTTSHLSTQCTYLKLLSQKYSVMPERYIQPFSNWINQSCF